MKDINVEKEANRLIDIKKTIADLQIEEKIIKKTLEPHIGSAEPLLMPDGKIYYYAQKTRKSFNRLEVLQVVEELCGSEAAQAIDIKCTKKKVIAKRLHVQTTKPEK